MQLYNLPSGIWHESRHTPLRLVDQANTDDILSVEMKEN